MSEIPGMNRVLLMHADGAAVKTDVGPGGPAYHAFTRGDVFRYGGNASALAVSVISGSLLLMVLIGVVAAAIPFVHVSYTRKKHFDEFLEHLPDALDLMSRALSPGHAFSEALHMISAEMPEPIATEFRKTYEEQNLGLSLKLALGNLTDRIPLLDLRMCVTAVLIQRETGGNLAEILKRFLTRFVTLSHHRQLEDTNHELTNVGMVALWPSDLVAVMITFMNPDYMAVLWKNTEGIT